MTSPVYLLKPSGVLNMSQAQQLRQEIDQCLRVDSDGFNTPDVFLVDLSQITFIDSSGLGSLVLAYKAVQLANKQFYVCSVGEQARMLFELTGLDQVFEVISEAAEIATVLVV